VSPRGKNCGKTVSESVGVPTTVARLAPKTQTASLHREFHSDDDSVQRRRGQHTTSNRRRRDQSPASNRRRRRETTSSGDEHGQIVAQRRHDPDSSKKSQLFRSRSTTLPISTELIEVDLRLSCLPNVRTIINNTATKYKLT